MDPIQFLPAHLQDAARQLPEGEQHTVLELPDAGDGHNAGLVHVASTCYWMGVSQEATLAHLRDIYDSDRIDYRTAPHRAVSRVWEHEGHVPIDSEGDEAAHVQPQEELLLRFKRTPTNSLIENSPASTKTNPKDIIQSLFDAEDIINIQFTGYEAGTLVKCSELPDALPAYKFLNPSTFKKIEGADVEQPDGSMKRMTRCNANVRERPYMVLEYDGKKGMSEQELAAGVERFTTFAMTVARFAPLVLAVDTGNKSIHFWYDTRKTKPTVVSKFFALARLHGTDKQLAVKSQIARMPNVSSGEQGRDAQTVVYFDPDGREHPSTLWDLVGLEAHILEAKQLEYFYAGKGTYYMQSNTERWVTVNRLSLGKQLARQGFRDTKLETEMVSPVDELIASFETDKAIEAALSGASGKHAGYYEDNGFNYLVLKSPVLIKPRRGEWNTIRAFLTHMFRTAPEQIDIFHGLLSASIKDFRNDGKRQSRISPCQALHIAGDNDSGKSFITKFILPPLFGGRWANAEAYFSPKASEHNSEMFMSELLLLDDTSVLETSYKARHVMTEKIKEITVGSGQAYRGMFQDRISSRPWWRLFRMLNANPEQLATLPLMEKGAEDKWILLHAASMDGGSVDKTQVGWFDPWKNKIVAEIPAYLHFLLREFTTPDEVKDPSGRFPVKSYKNPMLMDFLKEDSLESYLLHRIDAEAGTALFADPFDDENVADWKGTSSQLYDVLSEVGSYASQKRFAKTCPSPRVLSAQLTLLEKSEPQRFKYSNRAELKPKKLGGNFYWQISPKGEVGEEDCF